ncbi:hypothetical protein CGMCC3_g17738 [Colletotrichum fructicola]|uniref:Uncharacterized protein n=1 Tax=Colletotrichum fructicola (strain Nara gc5) TaxID=1213859 RepID=A0A7J6IF87_COLFN|nr:uncharacterized protein CGMCC3_g17738 [Colletotrichum fructicola]KAE9566085.1 hypothetical protein CGMCC3_g17738 [Colletotrichum fructicola]KAF4411229.1 hypothetical protein CFRS1_v014674 [Colletotrichum fructicola]KAF4475090.1 hypothetical protein CGGC5_v015522 [Colletotrichum fructicola Nara gc5]KAF5485872.1 hypothetical protein CGCF413_v013171 [Colletotrichum fructicola]
MFPFNSALNPASVAKRQRPELPSPRHEERACMEVPEDDEMADATEDLDFRFHDIDTEPGTRARKAPVPREMAGNEDDFEYDARAPSALSFDSGGVEGWFPYVRERLGQLETITLNFRHLSGQRRTANDQASLQHLYESLVMQVHSEQAELEYTLGQTDGTRHDFPMGDGLDSGGILTWRKQWQRRKRIRETIKEASLTLSECYRGLMESSLTTGANVTGSETEEANLLARLESARQKLEESIDPQGSKRINYPPRVRRERLDRGRKAGSSSMPD